MTRPAELTAAAPMVSAELTAAELMVSAAESALRSVDIDSADGWDAWCALESARAELATLRQKANPTDWL